MSTTKQNIKWFDSWGAMKRSNCVFNFFIGMRGVGKTYSALKGHREDFEREEVSKLLYLRTTTNEINMSAKEEDNPYKRLNRDLNWDIHFDSVGDNTKAYNIIDGDTILGSGRSLASFHNLRGVDFSDYDVIYWDECLPTENVVKTPVIKRSGYLFAHAYETINRNRELLGEEPVKVIFTANAFSLDSDLLRTFKLTNILQKMQETGQKRYTDKERSIYIELAESEDFKQAKQETALYKALSNDSEMVDIALNNKFTDYALSMVYDVPLTEYKPFLNVGGITFLEHRNDGKWYATARNMTVKENYKMNEVSVFRRRWYTPMKIAIFERKIGFDNADTYYKVLQFLEK